MTTISFKVNDEDAKLIREYAKINGLSLSKFILETILDRIEDDLALDEERILKAIERTKDEPSYTHQEVWKMLEI